MSMFYSKSTGGFYDNDFHDAMPNDCMPVTDAAYDALMDGQTAGQVIVADASGNPELTAAPAAPAPTILQQILALERQQTPRRMREAALGEDGGWLKNLDSEIATLRAQIAR